MIDDDKIVGVVIYEKHAFWMMSPAAIKGLEDRWIGPHQIGDALPYNYFDEDGNEIPAPVQVK